MYVRADYSSSPEQRLEAARLLRLSVDHNEVDRGGIDASPWSAEISTRVDEIVHGDVGSAPAGTS